MIAILVNNSFTTIELKAFLCCIKCCLFFLSSIKGKLSFYHVEFLNYYRYINTSLISIFIINMKNTLREIRSIMSFILKLLCPKKLTCFVKTFISIREKQIIRNKSINASVPHIEGKLNNTCTRLHASRQHTAP